MSDSRQIPTSSVPARVRWRQRFRKLHRWLAIVAGIPILLLTVTGLILVWEPELRIFEERAAGIVPVPAGGVDERLSLAAVIDALPATEDAARPRLILLPEKPSHAFVVQTDDDLYHFVDPYRGGIRKSTDLPAPVMSAVRVLHTSFFLGRFGTWIGILASLAFCFLSATGIYLFFKRRGPMRKRLQVHFDKGPVRRNYELHAVVGFWSAGLLALIALSGALIGIGDPWRNFILGITDSQFTQRPKIALGATAPDVDALVAALQEVAPPGLNATMVLLPTDPEDPLGVRYTYTWARRPASWGYIHPGTGEVLAFHHFPDFEPGHLIHRLNRGFHSGDLLTAGMRWLWFALMLAGTLLLLTGYRFLRPARRKTK